MFTIGCDPELFVYNHNHEQYVSAHNLVYGTKDKPFPVECGATQVDGVAAEFNIDPVDNVQQFIDNIDVVVNLLTAQIHTNGSDHFELVAQPVATFDPNYFETLPPEAKLLGCSPDYNAYTGDENDPPATDEPFRTGSGHVHVGYDWTDKEDIRNRVKQLDYVLFLSSLLWDSDHKRRDLYGMPGAFRYKPYGFEYRPLSNKWVGKKSLQRWVGEATLHAMHLYNDGKKLFLSSTPKLNYSRDTLSQYHRALHSEYGFPLLPEEYLEAA